MPMPPICFDLPNERTPIEHAMHEQKIIGTLEVFAGVALVSADPWLQCRRSVARSDFVRRSA